MYPYRYEEELLGFVNKGGHYFSLDTLTSKSIVITRIIYSSYIDYKNMYLPQNSFDGKPETAWLEKSEGSGIGEYIGFEAADRITADKIEILPGYFDKKWYADNNRVKHLTVELDDTEFDFSCQDKMQAHVFPLDGEKTFKNARFIVKEVYKSPKWDDTAIAEISFYYKGKKLEYDLGKVNN